MGDKLIMIGKKNYSNEDHKTNLFYHRLLSLYNYFYAISRTIIFLIVPQLAICLYIQTLVTRQLQPEQRDVPMSKTLN